MTGLPPPFGTIIDLLIVIIAFGSIVAIHELGHFVAAKWAGMKTLAFAVGFGPAILSYRRGMGWRRGSNVAEYEKLQQQGKAANLGSTEYRLNAIPFGGYVKVLGQDDLNPNATSADKGSYLSAPYWKRLVFISAGVVFNIVTAGLLFVLVFMIGLKTEPPVIGLIGQNTPAEKATALNAEELNLEHPGLRPGDRVLTINQRRVNTFSDIAIASAMARRGSSIALEVKRDGVPQPIRFDITPELDPGSKMLQIGVAPAITTTIAGLDDPETAKFVQRRLEELAIPAAPGWTVTAATYTSPDGTTTTRNTKMAGDVIDAFVHSAGQPVTLDIAPPVDASSANSTSTNTQPVRVTVSPSARLEQLTFPTGQNTIVSGLEHLLGFMPAAVIQATEIPAQEAGLLPGDILAQVGNVEWPSEILTRRQIVPRAGQTVRVVVARKTKNANSNNANNNNDANQPWELVDLGQVPVSRAGTIGFAMKPAVDSPARAAAWPSGAINEQGAEVQSTAHKLGIVPGSNILAVNNQPTPTYFQLRETLRSITKDAAIIDQATGERIFAPITVTLTIERPSPDRPTEHVSWTITPEELKRLHNLGWQSPLPVFAFDFDAFVLRATSPIDALSMGFHETHRVMLTVYVTFVRLFQGSVRVEHLKGPVGIAHAGTILAGRGMVWLLFFMAIVSINLAVINFLPIPITDGGHVVFILWEWITGKPVSPAIMNAAFLAGLVLLGAVFLIVTFNDITSLLRP